MVRGLCGNNRRKKDTAKLGKDEKERNKLIEERVKKGKIGMYEGRDSEEGKEGRTKGRMEEINKERKKGNEEGRSDGR